MLLRYEGAGNFKERVQQIIAALPSIREFMEVILHHIELSLTWPPIGGNAMGMHRFLKQAGDQMYHLLEMQHPGLWGVPLFASFRAYIGPIVNSYEPGFLYPEDDDDTTNTSVGLTGPQAVSPNVTPVVRATNRRNGSRNRNTPKKSGGRRRRSRRHRH